MEAVAELFIAEGIETEPNLRTWLCGDRAAGDGADAACGANITKLAAVHGIGPKTIDYFRILCGVQDTAAIDMHLTRFLQQAGVRVPSYEQARAVVAGAAAELGVPAARLDHSIWTNMSKAGRTW
jgi:endonuclease III